MERDEERRLREIEASLEREGPMLASRSNPERLLVSTRSLARCATATAIDEDERGAGRDELGI